jgi:hypothetical protein
MAEQRSSSRGSAADVDARLPPPASRAGAAPGAALGVMAGAIAGPLGMALGGLLGGVVGALSRPGPGGVGGVRPVGHVSVLPAQRPALEPAPAEPVPRPSEGEPPRSSVREPRVNAMTADAGVLRPAGTEPRSSPAGSRPGASERTTSRPAGDEKRRHATPGKGSAAASNEAKRKRPSPRDASASQAKPRKSRTRTRRDDSEK